MSLTVAFESKPEFDAALKDLRSSQPTTDWYCRLDAIRPRLDIHRYRVLIEHANGDPNMLRLSAAGSGSFDQLREHFDESKVMYALRMSSIPTCLHGVGSTHFSSTRDL